MKASVIICTYNRSGLLKDSVLSVQNQDFLPYQYEIIVVDNNSIDDTKSVVTELSTDSPVKVKYVFEGRQGLSFARNTGIANAEGEIIAFTDDDIDADKSWLKEIVHAFDDPDVAAAGGPIKPIWPDGRPEWLTDNWLGYLAVNEFSDVRESGEFKGPDYPYGANIAFRKQTFDEVGRFPTDLGRIGNCLLSNEEIMLCRRIEQREKRIGFAPNAIIYHKISRDRMRKIWFYHRTYWQSRSDAILDLTENADIYTRLRKQAPGLIWREISKKQDDFTAKCYDRLTIGYLLQLLSSEKNDFRWLRVLTTFLATMKRTASSLVTERNNKIKELSMSLDKKQKEDVKMLEELDVRIRKMDEIVGRVVEIGQRDEQLKLAEAQKNEELKQRDAQLRDKDKQLAQKDEILERERQRISEIVEQLQQKDEELKLKDVHLREIVEQLRVSSEQISLLEKQVQEMRSKKERLEEEIIRKDEKIKELLESMSWKVTGPLRTIYGVLRKRYK